MLIKKLVGNLILLLKEGLEKTYSWIEQQILSGSNIEKFCKSNIEKK